MGRKPIVSVTDENERISIKKCMYVGMYVCMYLTVFSFYIRFIKVGNSSEAARRTKPKEKGHKFVPTAPIGSKFRLLGNTRLFSFPRGDFLFSFFWIVLFCLVWFCIFFKHIFIF